MKYSDFDMRCVSLDIQSGYLEWLDIRETTILKNDQIIITILHNNVHYLTTDLYIDEIVKYIDDMEPDANNPDTYFERYTDGELDGYIWVYKKSTTQNDSVVLSDLCRAVDRFCYDKGIKEYNACMRNYTTNGYYVYFVYENARRWADLYVVDNSMCDYHNIIVTRDYGKGTTK